MSRVLSRNFASRYLKTRFPSNPFAISRVYSGSSGTDEQRVAESTHPNLNEHITRLLEKKAQFHLNTKADDPSHFKYIGYNRAVDSLKKYLKKIESGKEAMELDAVGKRLAAKIEEIIRTGNLQSLDDRRLKAIRDLLRVTEIKYTDAKVLYQKGISSVDDLRKNTHLLSKGQAKALEYLELTEMEIPKEEAMRTEELLQSILSDRVDSNLSIKAVYRGDAPIFGMEFIITHPDFKEVARKDKDVKGPRHPLLETVVDALKRLGFIKEDFAPTEKYKFVGLLQLWEKGMARLARFHFVTKNEIPFARLSFSNPPTTPRKIKEEALNAGYIIKEYGLNLPGGAAIVVQKEEEIYKLLKLNWVDLEPAPYDLVPHRTQIPWQDDTLLEAEMID